MCALGTMAARAQVIELRATINAAQETTGSTSPATGSAVMLYDVGTNTFDLTVTVNNLTNTISASHLHEAAAGVAGPVATGLGDESVYKRSGGTSVTATFTNLTYTGTPLTLLKNGAYINLHSAAWPGGEVRGQLIAQPKRLYAILGGQNEVPSNNSAAYGAALITYNPGTNKITTRLNLYNFTNTLTNSHYHEAAPLASGPVVHGLGGASVYAKTGTSYGAVFADQTYLGDPIKLLTGGAYLNVHSNVVAAGEIRGQVWASNELDTPRLSNVSTRGWVGTGDQVMIAGFVITGTEPVRVLITGKGPSLTGLGVAGALANPWIALHDGVGREIVTNDDASSTTGAADLAATGFAPTDAKESALLLVLPPGLYTCILSGVGNATGVGLAEVYEARPASPPATLAQTNVVEGLRRGRRSAPASPVAPAGPRIPLELCASVPLALAGRP